MNKEQLRTCVWWGMLEEARELTQKAEVTIENDRVYIDATSTVVFSRKDIAKHVLDTSGINPLDFDVLDFVPELDIFNGTLFDGDNLNGYGPEWFTCKAHADHIQGTYTVRNML